MGERKTKIPVRNYPVFHFALLIIDELSTLFILVRFAYFLLYNDWHF